MTIKDFVETSLQEIRKGVYDFNSSNERVKAEMPEEIEFDLAIVLNRGFAEVMELGHEVKETTRVKIKINTVTFLDKKEEDFDLKVSARCTLCNNGWEIDSKIYNKFQYCPYCSVYLNKVR